MKRVTRFNILALTGSILMMVGGILHLIPGYPLLSAVLDESVAELSPHVRTVWISCGLCYLILGGIALADARSFAPSRVTGLLAGVGALANATVVQVSLQGFHPAVAAFGLAGVALVLASFQVPKNPEEET